MALLTSLATLSLSCFDRDEIEEMLQWRVLQEGDFVDVAHGTYAHFYDQPRRMHWLHYLEDEHSDKPEDAVWRLDLHYEGGKDAFYTVSCDVDLEEQFATQDARFSLTMPLVYEYNGEKIGILVDMVNKNMMDPKKHSTGSFDVSMNFNVLDIELFPDRDAWQTAAQAASKIQKESRDLMPLGLLAEQVLSKGEKLDDELIGFLKYVAEVIRVNPIELMNLVGTVQEVEQIPLGNDIDLYDVTLSTDCGVFHLPIPESVVEVNDIEPGIFLSTVGFFSAMFLNEAGDTNGEKENVIPFNSLAH